MNIPHFTVGPKRLKDLVLKRTSGKMQSNDCAKADDGNKNKQEYKNATHAVR